MDGMLGASRFGVLCFRAQDLRLGAAPHAKDCSSCRAVLSTEDIFFWGDPKSAEELPEPKLDLAPEQIRDSLGHPVNACSQGLQNLVKVSKKDKKPGRTSCPQQAWTADHSLHEKDTWFGSQRMWARSGEPRSYVEKPP